MAGASRLAEQQLSVLPNKYLGWNLKHTGIYVWLMHPLIKLNWKVQAYCSGEQL
jgi:hypothetical protein